MGKEAECGKAGAASAGYGVSTELAYAGWAGAPRTPLRALLASESGSVWASQVADLVKSPGRKRGVAGSPSPPAGSSTGGHKIRVFKKSGAVQAAPDRPVQLGALFAQEREEEWRVEPHMQRLRDFISAELASSCAAPRAGTQEDEDRRCSNARSLKSPSPRRMETAKPTDESQELRYLFAKDWALQTSDEEGEFWDSGSLCGAPVPCRENPRRRSRLSKNEKFPAASRAASEPEVEIVEVPEFHVQSPEPPKPSLGALLAEEVGTSSGSPLQDARWSVPAAESSSRAKIASLDDISAPVRPESKSQLDVLIAKILTLRANSIRGNPVPVTHPTRLRRQDETRCSASGSLRTVEEVDETSVPDSAPDTVTAAAMSLYAPNSLLANSLSPDIREAPSEVPTSTTSTVVETRLTDASVAETKDNGGAAASSPGSSNGEGDNATARVQLGTLLERTWFEHGWLPLGRSQVCSPLSVTSRPSTSTSTICENSPRHVAPESSPERALSLPEPVLVDAIESAEATDAVDEIQPVEPIEPEVGILPGNGIETVEENQIVEENRPVEGMEHVEGIEPVGDSREGDEGSAVMERPAVRVSLLSLLSQDMETDEDGLQADGCECRDDEEDEVDPEELDPMCCVCMVGHKGAAFIPCGHTFCRKCCREVRRSIGSCPLCNQTIVDVLKLY